MDQPETISVSEHLSKLPKGQEFFFNLKKINLKKPRKPLEKVMKFFDDVYSTIKFPRYQSFNEINAIPLLMDSLSLINQKNYIIFRPFETGSYLIPDAKNTIVCTVIKPNTNSPDQNFYHNIHIKYNNEDKKFHLEFNERKHAFDSLDEVRILIEKHGNIQLEYFTEQEIEKTNNIITDSLTNLNTAGKNEYPLSHLQKLIQEAGHLSLESFQPRIIRITHRAVEHLAKEPARISKYAQATMLPPPSSYHSLHPQITENTQLVDNDNSKNDEGCTPCIIL